MITFALLLQWYWTYQVLSDPVEALKQDNHRCRDKWLAACFAIYTLVVVSDIIFVFTDNNADLNDLQIATGIILAIFGLSVLLCYCFMYLAYVLLMKKNPDLQVLS